jgi:signal transduction histidine kinase/CheY-like chemotaxis protein
MNLDSVVDAVLPGKPGDDFTAVRARFFVNAWLISAPIGLSLTVVYALGGAWAQAGLVSLLGLSGPVVLLLLHRGWRLEGVTHFSMGIASVVFSVSTLAQRPPDYTAVSCLVIVPLLGSFILGPKRGLIWLVIPIVAGVAAMYAADRGWLMDFEDPFPLFSHCLSFSLMMLLAWLYVRGFDVLGARALAREREAAKAKSAFLAAVSHEIRTPMNGVLGMTEVMLQDGALSSPQRDQLKVIQRSGRTLVSLINDVLDVSKIEAGRMTLETVEFSLEALLADVKALHAGLAEQKGIRLEVTADPSLGDALRGDALRLGQVLGNLVNNAIKFTTRGSVRVTVSPARPVDGERIRCRFVVEDSGEGIPAEQMGRLFARFEQGDSSTTRRFGGTGLGLALCQQLVILMGGRIEVDSEVGVGSRFHFVVELERGAPPEEAPVLDEILEPDSRHIVLVVDDNEINLRVASRLVEMSGYAVDVAHSGAEALVAVSQRAYCVVLMDCHMPEMDGFETTERIRAARGDALPILALTASAMPDEVSACRRAGMNDVLLKPVSLVTLRQALRRWAPRGAAAVIREPPPSRAA